MLKDTGVISLKFIFPPCHQSSSYYHQRQIIWYSTTKLRRVSREDHPLMSNNFLLSSHNWPLTPTILISIIFRTWQSKRSVLLSSLNGKSDCQELVGRELLIMIFRNTNQGLILHCWYNCAGLIRTYDMFSWM